MHSKVSERRGVWGAGEGSEAVGLLERIKAEGLRMGTHMYDTAARACSR
jgi:hypothetical protein